MVDDIFESWRGGEDRAQGEDEDVDRNLLLGLEIEDLRLRDRRRAMRWEPLRGKGFEVHWV